MELQEFRYGIELERVGRERKTVAHAIESVVGGEVVHVPSPVLIRTLSYQDYIFGLKAKIAAIKAYD